MIVQLPPSVTNREALDAIKASVQQVLEMGFTVDDLIVATDRLEDGGLQFAVSSRAVYGQIIRRRFPTLEPFIKLLDTQPGFVPVFNVKGELPGEPKLIWLFPSSNGPGGEA